MYENVCIYKIIYILSTHVLKILYITYIHTYIKTFFYVYYISLLKSKGMLGRLQNFKKENGASGWFSDPNINSSQVES